MWADFQMTVPFKWLSLGMVAAEIALPRCAPALGLILGALLSRNSDGYMDFHPSFCGAIALFFGGWAMSWGMDATGVTQNLSSLLLLALS